MQEVFQDEIFQLWCDVLSVSKIQMYLMGLLMKLGIQKNIFGVWVLMQIKICLCSQADIL